MVLLHLFGYALHDLMCTFREHLALQLNLDISVDHGVIVIVISGTRSKRNESGAREQIKETNQERASR